jgi:hypothetical protein
MLGIRLNRVVRRHFRAAVIWAALPLAVFNGRTVIGCGCFGHFEAVCHCGCCSEMQDGCKQHGKSASSCCTGRGFSHSNCPCCNHSEATNPCNTADSDSRSDSPQQLQGHHCKSIVSHEVTPVTVAPSVDAGDLHESIFVLANVGLPLTFSQLHVGRVVDFDTGPPPKDLVVTLHRLVI